VTTPGKKLAMSLQVKIECSNPLQAIEYKNQLIAAGLEMNRDFCWRWQQNKYDGFSYQENSYAEFEFVNPALASFYRLKWV